MVLMVLRVVLVVVVVVVVVEVLRGRRPHSRGAENAGGTESLQSRARFVAAHVAGERHGVPAVLHPRGRREGRSLNPRCLTHGLHSRKPEGVHLHRLPADVPVVERPGGSGGVAAVVVGLVRVSLGLRLARLLGPVVNRLGVGSETVVDEGQAL